MNFSTNLAISVIIIILFCTFLYIVHQSIDRSKKGKIKNDFKKSNWKYDELNLICYYILFCKIDDEGENMKKIISISEIIQRNPKDILSKIEFIESEHKFKNFLEGNYFKNFKKLDKEDADKLVTKSISKIIGF